MSDDPNHPDPAHELEIGLGAFLPEGSRFATEDEAVDGTDEPGDETAMTDGDESESDSNDADGPDDGWDTEAPAPDMSGAEPSQDDGEPGAAGASGGGGAGGGAANPVAPNLDHGWDTGAPAPEIPAWARDDMPPPPVIDRPAVTSTDPGEGTGPDAAVTADADTGAAIAPDSADAPEPLDGPPVTAPPEVDTTVLTRIEGELADVDAAIAAIDAGDLTRSPLLTELLAAEPAPSADQADQTPADEPTP